MPVEGNFVPILNNSPQAQMLIQFGQQMAPVIAIGEQLLNILNNLLNGTQNFAPIETMLGIPTGSGQTAFNTINGAMGALKGTMENSQCVNAAYQYGASSQTALLGMFVPVNVNASLQAQLFVKFGLLMAPVLAIGAQLLGILNNMLGASGPSQFTAIETAFGLPTGSGQTIFNIVNGSMGAMQGTMTNSQCVNATSQMG